jgi:hypothetical protein
MEQRWVLGGSHQSNFIVVQHRLWSCVLQLALLTLGEREDRKKEALTSRIDLRGDSHR